MSYNVTRSSEGPRHVLIVRLGAMGDVIHALPAVSRIKQTFSGVRISWVIEPRWAPLLAENPAVDEVIEVPTRAWRCRPVSPATWSEASQLRRRLRTAAFDAAIDFQGLLKSAMLARLSGAGKIYGFDTHELREPIARVFYSQQVAVDNSHVVDKNLSLVAAMGATVGALEFPLPAGSPRVGLPSQDFVLASPMAGWESKQWPPQYYAQLARMLWRDHGTMLLLDCAPGDRAYCEQIRRLAPAGACQLHISTLPELIAATRRARAVVGIDSGPLHLAAALGIPGVAIFGPTDPARNGPYGGAFIVMRAADALTSYKRQDGLSPSMMSIRPEQVCKLLEPRLAAPSAVKSR